jgi:two-component system CheB/CheR fusion protein
VKKHTPDALVREKPSETREAEEPMAIGNCSRTLFVEDHEDTREVMSGLLSRSGLKVDQARDAKGALALAERAEYDLLLIDIGLPGMNGLELRKTLCRDRKVPSIAITAYAYPKDVESCLEAGFDRCLVKPVGFDKLLAAIEEVCSTPPSPPTTRGSDATRM